MLNKIIAIIFLSCCRFYSVENVENFSVNRVDKFSFNTVYRLINLKFDEVSDHIFWIKNHKEEIMIVFIWIACGIIGGVLGRIIISF